jgi:hypothetical protein
MIVRKRILPILILLILFVFARAASAEEPRHVGVFDFDGNLTSRRTERLDANYLVHRTGEKPEIPVPTDQWRHVRGQIGRRGRYEDFMIGPETFREANDDERFVRNIAHALNGGFLEGPRFREFAQLLADSQSYPFVIVNSFRRNSPEAFEEVFSRMVKAGKISRVPRQENIVPVNHPGMTFRGQLLSQYTKISPSEGKLFVVLTALQEAEKCCGLSYAMDFSDNDRVYTDHVTTGVRNYIAQNPLQRARRVSVTYTGMFGGRSIAGWAPVHRTVLHRGR